MDRGRVTRWLNHGVTTSAARVAIAGVFVLYGGSKIPLLEGFAASIHNYRLVPVEFENIIAITLPWIEVLAATALLTRRWLAGGALLSTAMIVMFLVAVVSAIGRGLDINCGCFTLTAASSSYNNLWRTLLLDTVLLGLTIPIWRMLKRSDPGEAHST